MHSIRCENIIESLSSSSLSVIYFDLDWYTLHNCIHISLSVAWHIISLGCNLCVCWGTSIMFLFVLLDHVFLLHIQFGLLFPVIFTYYMHNFLANDVLQEPFSTPALRNTSHVLTLSVQSILNNLPRNQCSAVPPSFHNHLAQSLCFTSV